MTTNASTSSSEMERVVFENNALLKEHNVLLNKILLILDQNNSGAPATPRYRLQPVPADTVSELEILCKSDNIVSAILSILTIVDTSA